MTTFQDQPLSRRAVRQNERDQAEPDATSVDAASAPEAPAEPLTYATQSRPPVPEYDGPSFRVRAVPAAEQADASETPAVPQSEGGYRPRDFSPEGRRATGAPSWAPQYGGVGDDGALEYQTQGRVPAQPIAAEPEEPVSPVAAASAAPAGSLAASLGAPVGAPPATAEPASEVPADVLSPISDDVLGPIEHTLTRRELRALRDAHRLRTASTPVVDPAGELAPQAAPSSRLDSAVAEFDALAQAREAAGVDEPRAAPRGRRAYAPATNEVAPAPLASVDEVPAAEAAPAVETAPAETAPADTAPDETVEPAPAPAEAVHPDVVEAEAEAVQSDADALAPFDEDAAFADPALYVQPSTAEPVVDPAVEQVSELPAAEQSWAAEPVPLVEPPAYGYTAPQPVAPAYVAPEHPESFGQPAQFEQPDPSDPPVTSDQPVSSDQQDEQVEIPDPEHDGYVLHEPEAPVADSPLSAFEALFAPPAAPEPAPEPERFVAQPAAEAPAFEHSVYAQPEPPAYVQPEPPVAEQPVYEQPVHEQPVYEQPPIAETVYAVPDAPATDAPSVESSVAEPIAELPVPSEPEAEVAPAPAAEIVVPAAAVPAESTTTVVDVEVDPAAPSVGHWSTQAELEDETQQGNAMLAGGVGIGSAPLTTSALVLPSIPDQFGPNTGEVLVTGSISLPESFSVTGAHPAQLDQSDLDHMLDPGDHQVASTDSQPVRAIRAVSTHTSSRNVISTTKPKGNRALTVLIVAASAMAAVVITLLVVGLASGQL